MSDAKNAEETDTNSEGMPETAPKPGGKSLETAPDSASPAETAKAIRSTDGKRKSCTVPCYDPSKYTVKRGKEELESIAKTLALIRKRDPELLERYRHDTHKISRIVMRDVRPKNGYDPDKAARYFKATVERRELFSVEHILAHPPSKLSTARALFPEMHSVDREGYPVMFCKFGLGSMAEVSRRLTVHDWMGCLTYSVESLEKACRLETVRRGKWIDNARLVIDLEGISIYFLKGFLSYLRQASKFTVKCYTGLMKSTYVINAPGPLLWGYRLIKPFLADGVKRKTKIFSGGFQKCLLDVIAPEQLPRQYGGTLEWSPAKPGAIDWKAVDAALIKESKTKFDLKQIQVPAWGSHVVKQRVEAGSRVDWFFQTSHTPIKFESVLTRDDKRPSVPFAVSEGYVDSHGAPQANSVVVYDAGVITLTWINRHGTFGTSTQTLTFGVLVRPERIPQEDGSLGHIRVDEDPLSTARPAALTAEKSSAA